MSLRIVIVGALLLGAIGAGADRVGELVVTLREGQADQRRDAAYELGEMGPAARGAVPELIAQLHDRHWHERGGVLSALVKIAPEDPAVQKALDEASLEPDKNVREALGYALQTAPRAVLKRALAILERLVGDKEWTVSNPALEAVGLLGVDGAPSAETLLKTMNSDKAMVRSWAASALGKIGAAGAPAVPKVREWLGSADKWDRKNAAEVLGDLGTVAREAAPDLVKVTGDAETVVRLQAAYALGRMGEGKELKRDDASLRASVELGSLAMRRDAAALPKLLEYTKNDDPYVRELAGKAAIARGTEAVEGLVAALRSGDAEIRQAVGLALQQLGRRAEVREGAQAEAAVRALAAQLKDRDAGVRGTTAVALKEFRSPVALPALLEAVRSKEWDTRADALVALGGLKGESQASRDAMAAVIAALNDENAWVRSVAVRTLPEFGTAANEAVPRLIELLEDHASTAIEIPPPQRPLSAEQKGLLEFVRSMSKNGQVRDGVVKALGAIGPGAKAAVPALVEQARLKDREAIRALGSIGPDAADAAAPVLAGFLKESPISFDAAPALARMGGAGAVALVKALKDDKTEYEARAALERGGRGVVTALAAGLADEDAKQRVRAAVILGKIGPLAHEALPALRKMLRSDPDRMVQYAVEVAIREIGPEP